eukprot:376889_1
MLAAVESESINSAISSKLKMTDEELGSPLQLLKDEYDCADQETRVKAIKRLKMVGDVLGPEAVRSDLLPWLLTIDYGDDELMLALAEQLGQCVSTVGGTLHALLLLPCLERICEVDETVTRDKAVESIKIILGVMSHVDDKVVDLLKRMGTGGWFTSRVSACGLFGAAYARLDSQSAKASLLKLFEVMSMDDSPMVRRAAVSQLTALATAMEGDAENFNSIIMPLFMSMAAADQDNVQLLAVDQCPTIAELVVKQGKKAESVATLLSIVLQSVENASWRIRLSVAKSFPGVAKALGSKVVKKRFLEPVTKLLQDPETDVRLEALKGISSFGDLVEHKKFATTILPCLQILMQDTNLGIRITLSLECMNLCGILEFDLVSSVIQPMIIQLLNDDNSEVRLSIVDNLEVLSTWLPEDLEVLLPLILEMGQSIVWRVRRAVLVAIPFLAEKMGKEYFEKNALALYLNLFQDSVHDVRNEASMALAHLYQIFGGDWTSKILLPELSKLLDPSTYYLIRINVIHSLKQLLIPVEGEQAECSICPQVASKALEMVLNSLRDHVPNVRFTAVQALDAALPYVDKNSGAEAERWLANLIQNDPDPDVIFFAIKASHSVTC